MRNLKVQFLLLFLSLNGFAFSTSLQDPNEPSESEATEIQKIVETFMTGLQQSRDVGTLRNLFLDGFARSYLLEVDGSLHDLASDRKLTEELLRKISDRDCERLFGAKFNLNYFMLLQMASTLVPGKEPKEMELLPAEVFSLLQSNPLTGADYTGKDHKRLKYRIETMAELESFLGTVERAAKLMREKVQQSPPEITSGYKKNLKTWEASRPSSKTISTRGYTSTQKSLGLPPGTRFFKVMSPLEMFEFRLIKSGVGLKIVWVKVYPLD